MNCGHCYLVREGKTGNYITPDVLNRLRDAEFMKGVTGVVVVGKEPLANMRSIEILNWISNQLPDDVKLSIITNGIGLTNLPAHTMRRLAEVCVSLDGGPETYQSYRGNATYGASGSWERVVAAVSSLGNPKLLTVLHTVSTATRNIRDMMDVLALRPNKILFSPFIEVASAPDKTIRALGIEELFREMASCESFVRNPSAFLVLGSHSVQGSPREELRGLRDQFGLEGKVRWLGGSEGYVRLSHDGIILSSADALDMTKYAGGIHHLEVHSLQSFIERR
jgi:MoaA/NifB/PqqE/SkfB family radical SAM enzyme